MLWIFLVKKKILWAELRQKDIEDVQVSGPYKKAKVFWTNVDHEGSKNLVLHRFFFDVSVIALDKIRCVVLYRLKFFFKRVIK